MQKNNTKNEKNQFLVDKFKNENSNFIYGQPKDIPILNRENLNHKERFILGSPGEGKKRAAMMEMENIFHSMNHNLFDDIHSEDDISRIVKQFLNSFNGQKSSDPYWEKAEDFLLQAILLYLYKECPKSDQNMNKVLDLLQRNNYALDRLFVQLGCRNPYHIAVKKYNMFKLGAGKIANSIIIDCMLCVEKYIEMNGKK